MVCKVDGNPQLDTCDRSMCSTILKANKLSLNSMRDEIMLISTSQNIMKISNLIVVRVDREVVRRGEKLSVLNFH